MFNDRLTEPEQLVPGLLVTLVCAYYGRDIYRVTSTAYENGNEWFVLLTHFKATTPHEYSLNELGITTENPNRWVETELE